MKLIREGKVKRVFQDSDSEKRIIIEFTDSVTAGDGAKKGEYEGKGVLTSDISYLLLGYLEGKGIDTHLVKNLEGPMLLCRKASIVPIEIVCRNISAGSFCRRYGIEKGVQLKEPLIEFFLKDDSLGDPLINAKAVELLEFASSEDLLFMESVTRSVNYYLCQLMNQVNLKLVDFKLEFGRTEEGYMVLADEMSPDTMRIWDSKSKSLDKDIFREGKDGLVQAYDSFYQRIREGKGEDVKARNEVIEVVVEPKEGIKNPPGEVTRKALTRLGFGEAVDVRAGKIFRIYLKGPITSEILKKLKLMGVKLLSNPISETQRVRLG